MSISFLKESCPCGDPRCSATGAPRKSTGHSPHCWDGCPTCARGSTLRPTGRKIPTLIRRQVRARSGGRCEVVMPNGERCQFDADHMHHKRRKSQGGQDSAANLLDACWTHHDLIHSSEGAAWAIAEGYLIAASSGPEPLSTAVRNVERVER